MEPDGGDAFDVAHPGPLWWDAWEGKDAADVPQEDVQRMLQLGVRLYFQKRDADEVFGPFAHEPTVSATEVLVAVANMLEAVDVDVFELGMWKSMSGS